MPFGIKWTLGFLFPDMGDGGGGGSGGDSSGGGVADSGGGGDSGAGIDSSGGDGGGRPDYLLDGFDDAESQAKLVKELGSRFVRDGKFDRNGFVDSLGRWQSLERSIENDMSGQGRDTLQRMLRGEFGPAQQQQAQQQVQQQQQQPRQPLIPKGDAQAREQYWEDNAWAPDDHLVGLTKLPHVQEHFNGMFQNSEFGRATVREVVALKNAMARMIQQPQVQQISDDSIRQLVHNGTITLEQARAVMATRQAPAQAARAVGDHQEETQSASRTATTSVNGARGGGGGAKGLGPKSDFGDFLKAAKAKNKRGG